MMLFRLCSLTHPLKRVSDIYDAIILLGILTLIGIAEIATQSGSIRDAREELKVIDLFLFRHDLLRLMTGFVAESVIGLCTRQEERA